MTNLWEYRGLIKKIAITDLKIRYKSSILGFFWSLLQPLLIFLVLNFVFTSMFANNLIHDYSVYLLLGIVIWGFFDKATSFSLTSIVGKPTLVKKVYFPREVLIISACLTALMMTLLEFAIFLVFMFRYNIGLSWPVLLVPAALLLEFVFVAGVSLAIASLNVRYRDIQYIWTVVMQIGFFITPIMYTVGMLGSSPYVSLIRLNPMAVIIDIFRDLLIYARLPSSADVAFVVLVSLVTLAAGWIIFRGLEPIFGEEV